MLGNTLPSPEFMLSLKTKLTKLTIKTKKWKIVI